MTDFDQVNGKSPALWPGFFLLAVLFVTSGCVTPFQDGREAVLDMAKQAGWHSRYIEGGAFRLLAIRKPTDISSSRLLTVYIEGDGVPWARAYRISSDPTPPRPLVLALALKDPSLNTLYLGRPCQYVGGIDEAGCSPVWWTSHRYGEEIVHSLDMALEAVKRDSPFKNLHLVGYSGGGTLAVLLAARRSDVVKVTTIGANLDHVAWTAYHGDSPLTGSLNAKDFVHAVGHISQTHFVGDKDEVVPQQVVETYMAALPHGHRAEIRVMGGFGHATCWLENWPID